MPDKYDLRKEWPKIREQLMKISSDTVELAKKGEEQLVNISHKSKMHLDATALNLRKERLYYQIGKQYVKAKAPGQKPASLQKLLDELEGVEKEARLVQRRIKAAEKAAKKKRPAKKASGRKRPSKKP